MLDYADWRDPSDDLTGPKGSFIPTEKHLKSQASAYTWS